MTKIAYFRLATIVMAAALAFVQVGIAVGQTREGTGPAKPDMRPSPLLAAPIVLENMSIIQMSGATMAILTGRSHPEVLPVLEISVRTDRRNLERLSSSMKLRLFIGPQSYNIHRTINHNPYSNGEAPIDPELPSGKSQSLIFLIPDWHSIAEGLPMFLTIIPPGDILWTFDGAPSQEALAEVFPEIGDSIPLFEASFIRSAR